MRIRTKPFSPKFRHLDLPDYRLRHAPDAVLRIWQGRERIELQAADLFARLAAELRQEYGSRDPITKLAEQSSIDEQRHATLCRKILLEHPSQLRPLKPSLGETLGPGHLDRHQKILYMAVAIGCVTETLSTALLVEMHKRATHEPIRYTIHEILKDEISHSRIGWAELARAAEKHEVGWLSKYIAAMIRGALYSDVAPMLNSEESEQDLSAWGILPPSDAQRLMRKTIHEVIFPGLKNYLPLS